MNVEKFIECIKKYPILYSGKYDYRNYNQKLKTWEIVAEEMNESSEYLQTRWKGLKDGYTKYKRNVKPYKDWCWGPDMKFFEPYLKHRKSKIKSDNDKRKRHDQSSTSMPSPTQSIIDITVKTEPNILDTIANASSGDGYLSEQAEHHRQESSCTMDIESHRISTESEEDIMDSNDIDDPLLSKKRAKRSKRDANYYLFMSYAETFKTLSVTTQANLKVEMAKLFADAELQEFKINQANT